MGSSLPSLTIPAKNLPNANVALEYTPPNWSKSAPQLYCITYKVPLSATELKSAAQVPDVNVDTESSFTLQLNAPGAFAGYNPTTRTVMLVFDALRRANHSQSANVTNHPLQIGYNISDHVIQQPNRITLEVSMSDAIASYSVAGHTPMWQGNPSKSISAYQQMKTLMANRQLVTLNTRLQVYSSMVLVDIQVEDTQRTYFGGLAMSLTFQEVFIADATVSYESARMQASEETKQGTVQAQAPSKTVVEQHNVPTALDKIAAKVPLPPLPKIAPIPGAGFWTSTVLTAPIRTSF